MEQRPGKTTHACRNLFRPVDHEQLRQDFQHMLHNSMEGAQQKWNFSFLRDTPAEGLLQWEELRGHKVPAFYHSCVVGVAQRPLQHLNWPPGQEVPESPFSPDYYSTKKRIKTNMRAAAKKSTS